LHFLTGFFVVNLSLASPGEGCNKKHPAGALQLQDDNIPPQFN